MKILDTNIIIRFLVNDDIEMGLKARNLLKSEKYLMIPDSVFPEVEYVLRKLYDIGRQEIAMAIESLCIRPNIMVAPEVIEASQIYKDTKLAFVDCLVLSNASTHSASVASFDKAMLKYSQKSEG